MTSYRPETETGAAGLNRVRRSLSWRDSSLDRFRGLAVLLMLLDHVVLVFHGPELVRHTVGRLALPMFFLLAGHLARRLSMRHAWVALAGLALPVVVPWIDVPNVLVLWALGSLVLWVGRWGGLPWWAAPVVALTLSANGWGGNPYGYNEAAVVGLMAVGSVLDRSSFAWAGRLPAFLGAVGRHPVAWYLGHLVVLQALIVWAALR